MATPPTTVELQKAIDELKEARIASDSRIDAMDTNLKSVQKEITTLNTTLMEMCDTLKHLVQLSSPSPSPFKMHTVTEAEAKATGIRQIHQDGKKVISDQSNGKPLEATEVNHGPSTSNGNKTQEQGEPQDLDFQKDLVVESEPLEVANTSVEQGNSDVTLPVGVLPWDLQVPEGWTSHWESDASPP